VWPHPARHLCWGLHATDPRLVDPASELTGRRPVERTVRLDDDGLVELPGATSWPLEL
jgi:hypothetical protein